MKRHRKNMMPWSYVLAAALATLLIAAVLSLGGLVPFWIPIPLIVMTSAIYWVWDKKTDKTNNTWGEGARGEARVGRELERLHAEGFHIFHDWDKGRGNVDHFIVGPPGVFAIETKAWTGEITAQDGRLMRNGRFVPDNIPVKQAMKNAMAVRDLIGGVHAQAPFVVPVLCFSKATVSQYGPIGKVEISSLGSINRVIMQGRRRRYSPEQVSEISARLEEHLGEGPAARPGMPPEEPTRTSKMVHRLLSLPTSTIVLYLLGICFLISLALPTSASKVFLGIAYLYHLLSEAWSNLR